MYLCINLFIYLKNASTTAAPTISTVHPYKQALNFHPGANWLCYQAGNTRIGLPYHVNRCGHHKKLSIAKFDFV